MPCKAFSFCDLVTEISSNMVYYKKKPKGRSAYVIYKNYTGRSKKLMDERDDILIVDVRNPEEYAQGHIPGAINVPNPSITNREIPELPDKNQELLIYCRSGQRSKIAGKKLAVLGYQNIKDFGGIMEWKYEVE